MLHFLHKTALNCFGTRKVLMNYKKYNELKSLIKNVFAVSKTTTLSQMSKSVVISEEVIASIVQYWEAVLLNLLLNKRSQNCIVYRSVVWTVIIFDYPYLETDILR